MMSLLWRLWCFILQICPRCQQSFYDPVTKLYFYFCQTPGCEEGR